MKYMHKLSTLIFWINQLLLIKASKLVRLITKEIKLEKRLVTSSRPLLFMIITSIKRVWIRKQKWCIFLRILENSFWKYLIYKRVSWSHWLCFALFVKIKKKSPTSSWSTFLQGRRGRREGRAKAPLPFSGAKIFFPCKIRKYKIFTCD